MKKISGILVVCCCAIIGPAGLKAEGGGVPVAGWSSSWAQDDAPGNAASRQFGMQGNEGSFLFGRGRPVSGAPSFIARFRTEAMKRLGLVLSECEQALKSKTGRSGILHNLYFCCGPHSYAPALGLRSHKGRVMIKGSTSAPVPASKAPAGVRPPEADVPEAQDSGF